MKKTILLLCTLVFISCSVNSTKATIESNNALKKLSKEKLFEFNHYLNHFVSSSISTKKTVIVYIDNDPRSASENFQVPWDIFNGDLAKELKAVDNCNLIWVVNQQVKNLYYYHGDTINWKVDQGQFLRTNFFPHEGMNGGFLIVNTDGNYVLKEGEYTKKELLNNFKKFNSAK